MLILKTFLLFVLTALAEIAGCYLPYPWLRRSAVERRQKIAKASVPDKKL